MRRDRRPVQRAAKPGKTRRAARRPNVDTKESLLDAAERLFAEHGLQGVSLRMINAAAGARNASAAHYHFRSRDRLVKTLARRRMDKLSQERLADLQRVEAEAAGGPPDVHAIVAAVTLPTFRMLLDDRDGGANYVRFLARAAADPTIRFSDLATEQFNYVIMIARTMLRRALPHVPPPVLDDRMMFGIDIGILAPLRIDRLARRVDGTLDREAVELFAGRLIDYVAGGLSAPVSRARVDLAERSGRAALDELRIESPGPTIPGRSDVRP